MKKLGIISFAVLILTGCVKNNPDPAWLEVNAWTLEQNSSLAGDEGVLEHNFTDAWVYVDDKLVGVFEVPFKIPILESGTNKKITLYPTIKNNGISSTKKIYPFVEPMVVYGDLVQNQTLTINPTTKYYSQSKFFIWDFEDTSTGIDATPSSTTSISFSNDPTILTSNNGSYFGRVNLTDTDDFWQAVTTQSFSDIPQEGAEVYMEVSYHNTVSIITGVLALESSNVVSNPNVQLNDQDAAEVEWKKIYIDLKTIISGSVNANAFQFSFEGMLPDSLSTGQINLDNIKLVHF